MTKYADVRRAIKASYAQLKKKVQLFNSYIIKELN
jgi:hypothetical protein